MQTRPVHPIATWSEETDMWEETGAVDIFGLSVAFSATLPLSGMTRGGRMYAQPTLEPPTSAAASSSSPGTLLPTPRTSDTNGPGTHGDGGMDLRTAVTLLPTPPAYDGSRGGTQDPAKRRAGGHQPSIADVVEHL